VTAYRLSAPVVVAGEARPDDPALVDRLVSVMPDKNRLDEHPEHIEAYRRLRAFDLGLLATPYVRFILGRDTAADLRAAVDIADNVLARIPGGNTVSLRCRDNLRVVVLGLTMFEAFAESMGIDDLPELDVEAALHASIEDLMDGEKGAKNPLDLFVETCSVLAYNGALVPDKHFAVVDGLTCLHLRACWEVYLEHRKRVGQAEETSGLRVLRRLLRENHARGGYVKDLGKQVQMGDRRPRLVAIDLTQAALFLDVDEFPEVLSRSWGGSLIPNKSPGRLTFTDVTLERGATTDLDMFNWFSEVAATASRLGAIEPEFKRNLDIVQQDRDGGTLRRWSLNNAWPTKFVAGDWDNEADENVIESVTLTYDFFDLA